MKPISPIPSIERFHVRALQLALWLIPPIALVDQVIILLDPSNSADPTLGVYAAFWVLALYLTRRNPVNSTPFFISISIYLTLAVLTVAWLDYELPGAAPMPSLAMVLGVSILTVALTERRTMAVLAAHSVMVLLVAIVGGIDVGLSPDEIFIGAVGPATVTAIAGLLIVSMRNHLTETLTQLNRAAEAQSKLVAVVSHELRTPLTTVTGLAWELAEDDAHHGSSETAELLGLIAEQADDLAVIVEDLLTSARLDAGTLSVEPDDIEVAREVMSVADELNLEATIGFELSGGTARAHADPTRTRQILRNLLTNAVRYGGPNITVNIERLPGSVSVFVSDDGPPLDPAAASEIFDAYTSAVDQPPPTAVGIGLHVSRQLAKTMGGDLDYDADRSGFRLTLPPDDAPD